MSKLNTANSKFVTEYIILCKILKTGSESYKQDKIQKSTYHLKFQANDLSRPNAFQRP